MSIVLNKKNINSIFISILIFICVLVPSDIYNLKKIFFIIIIGLNAKLIIKSIFNNKNLLITFYGSLFPIFLFLYSSILTGDLLTSFSRSFASFMLLILFIIKKYEVKYENILLNTIKALVMFTLLLMMLDIFKLINVNAGMLREKIIYGYSIGLMGKSMSYPFYYKIFFKTSPLFVLLLFKQIYDTKYFMALITLVALIVSGIRANVLFPVLFILLYILFNVKNKYKIFKYMIFIFIFATLMLFLDDLILIFKEVFISKGAISDTIRLGHIQGIKELFVNKPWIILFGSGMGSEFYSYGINSLTSSIEWSYVDLFRQMGIFFFMIFMFFVLAPFVFIKKIAIYKKYSYITYLFIAATNPLLFSSTSYLVFIYMYINYYNNQKNIKGVAVK